MTVGFKGRLDMGLTSAINVLFATPPESPNPVFNVGPFGAWNPTGGGSAVSSIGLLHDAVLAAPFAPDATSRIRVSSPDGVVLTIYLSNISTIWTCGNAGNQTFIPYGAGGAPWGFVSAMAASSSAVFWTDGTDPQTLRTSSDDFNSATSLCEATPSAQGLVVDGHGDVFWTEAGPSGGSVLWRYDSATKQRVSMWKSPDLIYAFALAT